MPYGLQLPRRQPPTLDTGTPMKEPEDSPGVIQAPQEPPPEQDPVAKLKALLDSIRPQPAQVNYPAPQLPQGPDPELMRQTLDRANTLGLIHGAFGVRTPSTYEVMKTGSAQPQMMPSPSYDAARAGIMAPLQQEQARVDLANKQGETQNRYSHEKAKFGLQAHQQENAAGLAEMKALLMGAMLGPKLQNAQDVAKIGAGGRVEAAKVGAQTRLEGPPISDDALTQQAQAGLDSGQIPNAGNAGTRAKIANRMATMQPDKNLAGSRATNKANSASLTKLQTMSDTTDAFESTALKNLDQFLQTAKTVTDTGSPALNKPARWLDENMGDPNVAAFRTARQVAITEIAKVLSASNSQITDSARKEVGGLIGPDATGAQIAAAAQILKTDMENRRGANKAQIQTVTGRLGGKTVTGYQRNLKTGARRAVYSDGTYGQPE